jgi:hypothetical protein
VDQAKAVADQLLHDCVETDKYDSLKITAEFVFDSIIDSGWRLQVFFSVLAAQM